MNKYIFELKTRKKLLVFSVILLYSVNINVVFFIIRNAINNIDTYSFFYIIAFVFYNSIIMLLIPSYEKTNYYMIFLLMFFICSLFSDIVFLLDYLSTEIFSKFGRTVSHEEKVFFYYGEVFALNSFFIGLTIFIIDRYINMFLFPAIPNNCSFNVDTASNRFAVDVVSFTIYIGMLLGIIVYDFLYSEESKKLFFSGVNLTHITFASVGIVTFFWAAKSAKSKSIELDITRSREAGRLFSEGSLFLSAPHNDKQYVGLSYLNMIAGQSEGPLQKEAIDLMKDFILSASDVTTANKPRIRAMEYLSERLKTDFWDDKGNELIRLLSSELTASNESYYFPQLNIVYEKFSFSNDKKYLREFPFKKKELIKKNNESMKGLIAYDNCNFENFSGQNGIEKIIQIYANNCHFKNCKIRFVKGYSKKPKTSPNNGQKGESTPSNNKFEQCDFSDSDGWNILRPSKRMEGEISEIIAENSFINCFYYSGHEPKGFVKERDGALLMEITSKEQFEVLIGSSSFMQYAPPTIKTKPCKFLLKLKNEL